MEEEGREALRHPHHWPRGEPGEGSGREVQRQGNPHDARMCQAVAESMGLFPSWSGRRWA